jgi:hypothetical protein
VTGASAISAIQVCYSTALGTLEDAYTLGKMDVLYYLWDTAYLMIAYSAMVLLKILRHARLYGNRKGHKSVFETIELLCRTGEHETVCAIRPIAKRSQGRVLWSVMRDEEKKLIRGGQFLVHKCAFILRQSLLLGRRLVPNTAINHYSPLSYHSLARSHEVHSSSHCHW